MESVWLQLRRLGRDPFREVGMSGVPSRMRVDLSFDKAVRSQADVIVDSTNYWREIEVFRQHFPDEQILVLLFEDFVREPRATMRRCCEFLGVDADAELESYDAHLNPHSEYRLPNRLIWRLWSTPRSKRIYDSLAGLVPSSVRDWVSRSLLDTSVTERPQWNTETRNWALARLGDDTARFLEFYGYPSDSWQR